MVQVLETKLEVFKINVKLSRVLGILKFYYFKHKNIFPLFVTWALLCYT